MMTEEATSIAEAALDYARRGWRVLPINRQTKLPIVKEWQRIATTDEGTIEAWWSKWPEANVGVCFGEATGLVDFEYDSDGEKEAFLELFGGDVPFTLAFKSSRGRHYLFRWRADIPGGATKEFEHKGAKLKIRVGNQGLGAQSVFPPSMHQSGWRYEWLPGAGPDECEAAEIPDAVITRLWNDDPRQESTRSRKPREFWESIIGGVSEGGRNDAAAKYIGLMLRGAANIDDEAHLAVIYQSAEAVNERNRPPLSEKELRTTFESIYTKEKQRRTLDGYEGFLTKRPAEKVREISDDDSRKLPLGLRLVIVKSDPPAYELYSPAFEKAKRGCIVLTAEQMCSFHQVRIESLRQADYPLAAAMAKPWNQEDGIYERLVHCAEERDAPAEEKRQAVIAERILAILAKARIASEEKKATVGGKCFKFPDGVVGFSFTKVWEDLRNSADKVTRNELSQVVRQVGGSDGERDGIALKLLSRDALSALERLSKLGSVGRTI